MKKLVTALLMMIAMAVVTSSKARATEPAASKHVMPQMASIASDSYLFQMPVQLQLVNVEPETRLEFPRVANETCKGSDYRTVLVKPPTLSNHHLFSWSLARR